MRLRANVHSTENSAPSAVVLMLMACLHGTHFALHTCTVDVARKKVALAHEQNIYCKEGKLLQKQLKTIHNVLFLNSGSHYDDSRKCT